MDHGQKIMHKPDRAGEERERDFELGTRKLSKFDDFVEGQKINK